ncbi:MAG: translation initiation factor IF-2 subunit gamma [Candidatus Woesearchaeota archaeon]|jgi:translation initiation factor 2 subunit 3|nr:translation initiation factor IF-2 subunit gamma [Candidatus Woesearchaeota archaeon]|tara:strand:- start:6837 stop:8102 length:1266 start_codon:yes stop_codon:yes gene_type:complete
MSKAKKPAKANAPKEKILQPEVNIGMVGHVDHGKTTLLERLSGVWTDTHSEEIKRGITIRLGYADTVFYKEDNAYTTKPKNKSKAKVIRKVSFVDSPGHESLMATMLSGATIMDGALLLIAANEECPQPQTREHLMALEIIGIKNVVIIQNKIDLVDEKTALKNYSQVKDFVKGTSYKNAPIIPLSAQHNVGVSALIKTIEEIIPTPKRDKSKDPIMLVARSFDINLPGILPKDLTGGILGGSMKEGTLKKGQEIEIRPGRSTVEKNKEVYKPIITKIKDIKYGGASVDEFSPGGTAGLLTSLDPSIVKADQLSGSVVGLPGKLPDVLYEITISPDLLKRVLGTKDELNVEPIKMNEALMLNVNSAATVGIVTGFKKKNIVCKLKIPVCAELSSRVTISRRIGNRFRLIGYGEIQEGKTSL